MCLFLSFNLTKRHLRGEHMYSFEKRYAGPLILFKGFCENKEMFWSAEKFELNFRRELCMHLHFFKDCGKF